ncbi:MAG TPA: PLP-dependent aminotransferase family protein, partial [Anaeromyxobacteraceae bacterium]|nr:PLP-dependent aminotransferase family protein [Anaeromyxobacteraceae bacterium]
RTLSDPSLVPLGTGAPNPQHLPVAKLNRMLAAQARRHPAESVSYSGTTGLSRLRTQIARRSLDAGCPLSADDVVVTSGCVEAVTLALQTTCRAGDTVAVAAPAYYNFLNFAQWMGLKVLEIPARPEEGMSLDVLGYAIRQNPIRACIVIANFDNPLGSLMPDERKRDLVRLLAKHEIPLVEDDVYGDLAFGPARPPAAKAFDENGLVLLCSSFSKTLAPGYRVGWIAPGRFQEKVERLKPLLNVATASPTQLAVAEFLTNGGYDHHLRAVRRVYARQVDEMRDAVLRHFPCGTSVSRPRGGFLLWADMPAEVDAFRLYDEARQRGIGVAPGTLFSAGNGFRNCVRLNASFWSASIARAVEELGAIARGIA